MTVFSYDMQRMLMDFTVDELAEGAEWLLSDAPVVNRKCCYEDPAFHPVRHDDILMARSRQDALYENSLTYYQATDPGDGSSGATKTELCIDENRGEFVRSWCNCSDFRADFYSCKHTNGLAMQYLLDRREPVKGSAIERRLKAISGAADPLCPGVLLRTSRSLEALRKPTNAFALKLMRPAWQTGERRAAAQRLNVEVYLSVVDDDLAVELRVGTKRPFQIKNMNDFLDAYRNNLVYSFSSALALPAGRENYAEKAAEMLDYLCQVKQTQDRKSDKGEYGSAYYSAYRYSSYHSAAAQMTSAQLAKVVFLRDHDMDQFMELLDGGNVYYTGGELKALPCVVNIAKEPKPVRLSPLEYGMQLAMEKEQLIACGFSRMYLLQDHEILSLPAESWELRKQLLSAFSGRGELYVQNDDLPAIADALYQAGGDSQKELLAPLHLSSFQKETPLIRIYLDYPQPNLISCRMQAHYPGLNKSYDLFLQDRDAGLRNLAAEQAVGEILWSYFDAWNQAAGELVAECEDNRLYRFLSETIPSLSRYGEVLISDRLKKLRMINNPTIQVGLQVNAGSLLMSLQSDEISKEEIIEVLSTYNRRKHFTRLKNGSFITHDENQAAILEALSETFRAYGKKNPEAMKLPLFRALYMDELLRDRDDVLLDEGVDYQKLLHQLREEDARAYPVPEQLAEVLRLYQLDGYRWMRMLKDNGFGGILADDMGLGKTLQILAFLQGYKAAHPDHAGKASTLIVAPASLVYNWQKEIRRFTPGLTCQVLAGSAKERKLRLDELRLSQQTQNDSSCDIYITSYDLLKRDIQNYEGIHFENQVIDEAQFIKNQGTQVAKAVRLIDSSFRMALTGTPIENRLSELWSIFDYIMPGFLYSYARFREDYESPIINNQDTEVMERLRRMVHPFILRRLKKDVLKDLPDKLEENVSILLEGEQRKVYDAYAKRLRLYLDKQSEEEYRQNKLEILAELTKLRQICCGPEVFLENYKGKNAKQEACIELVHRAIDGGHKLLLFSQFTKVLDELGKRLSAEKIDYYRIDGSTSKENRMKLVDAFQQDNVPVFLISLKAGGTGLNLTAADIVIHYDPWWNLAAQNQATDRTHRIGQQNTVTVYNLIAENTIEEQITLLQKTKAQLAEDILSGEGISSIMIHKEDLLALL